MKKSLRILFFVCLILVCQVCTQKTSKKERGLENESYLDYLYAKAKESLSLDDIDLNINLKNIKRATGLISLAIIIFTFYYLYSWVVSIYNIIYFFVSLPFKILRFFIYIMLCGCCWDQSGKSVRGKRTKKENERKYRELKERERKTREKQKRQRFDDDSDDASSSYSYGTRTSYSDYSNYSSQYSQS